MAEQRSLWECQVGAGAHQLRGEGRMTGVTLEALIVRSQAGKRGIPEVSLIRPKKKTNCPDEAAFAKKNATLPK